MPQVANVNRIHITGNAGSGKSTLARLLAERTGLPLFGLDTVVWQPGWKKTPRRERIAAEAELVQKSKWIIEGVSTCVREAADLVIFLDRPRLLCALRCCKRNLPYLFKSRPGVPPNCPELIIFPKLLEIIWRFPDLVGSQISAEANEPQNKKRIVRLQSDAAVLEFVREFGVAPRDRTCANLS